MKKKLQFQHCRETKKLTKNLRLDKTALKNQLIMKNRPKKLVFLVKDFNSIVCKLKKHAFAIKNVFFRGGVEDTPSKPRPKILKKSEAKTKDRVAEDRLPRSKDKNAQGQGLKDMFENTRIYKLKPFNYDFIGIQAYYVLKLY